MPEFFRLDEFAIRADMDITRRDRTRMLGFGFDTLSRGYVACPRPGAQRYFRMDEFAVVADGAICIRDRVRFTSFGFDIASAGPVRNLDTYANIGLDFDFPAPLDGESLVSLILDVVVEEKTGPEMSTGMWTIEELVSYINETEADFLKRSSIVLLRAAVPTIPQNQRHQLPDQVAFVKRAAYRTPSNVVLGLHRVDEWELDHVVPDWQYETGTPNYWMDQAVPQGIIQTGKSGELGGRLEVLCVPIGGQIEIGESALKEITGDLAVPCDFAYVLKWGVLQKMLGKVGRANDPPRAEYTARRYQEGLEAARLILSGWES